MKFNSLDSNGINSTNPTFFSYELQAIRVYFQQNFQILYLHYQY